MPVCLENSAQKSDSESDEDYVPPQNDKDSDSEQSDKEDEVVDEQAVTADPETKKRAREALWSSFQASVSNAALSSSSLALQEPRKVKIQRKYRFAGEEVVEVVEVPEDSLEAKKWPLWKEPLTESSTDAPTEVSLPLLPVSSMPVAASSSPLLPPTQTPNPVISLESVSTSLSTKLPVRKPGPRKPKTSLTPLPGSSKAKKISTLDKSAMDWQTHVHAEQHSGLKDELEANRKGGGYLEKVQFLKRVEERKDETLEALKSTKRRKL